MIFIRKNILFKKFCGYNNINKEYYLNQLISQKDKDIVKIVTGIRRSGKSILLFELFYNHLIESGISDSHIIKLAFDSKKNRDLKNSDLLYEYISNKIIDDEKYYILLDKDCLTKI